jgi:hexosaminidase
METKKIVIVPTPKNITYQAGNYFLRRDTVLSVPGEDKQIMFNVAKRLQGIIKDALRIELPILIRNIAISNTAVVFKSSNRLQKEEYTLKIEKDLIQIIYGSAAGAFHAVSTLKQIVQNCGKALPCLVIEDHPDFEVRGLMLDISRNKIPRIETIYKTIDFMADLKLNHFQLYIEGFSFAYPSFPGVWCDGTPITGEEMLLIGRYCKERFIDFVPNQNSFGHMTKWLSRKEFNGLAECPNGCIAPSGPCDDPMGLNPTDENALKLLDTMYDDLLPYFDSSYFNVGCDETFDLGQGKSKEQCEKFGEGRVYLNFLLRIYDMVKKQGKKMIFWGDIIIKYPELIPELPKDIVAMEWGYDADQPSSEDCEKFAASGIAYYICPGANTWNSIAGRTDVMRSNLLNAAAMGKKYGAAGYINTDWGDGGHWQTPAVSYPSYCLGAALSWGVEQNQDVDIAAYLNQFVFMDKNAKMGELVLNLGNSGANDQDALYNGTGIFRTLYYSQLDDSNTFLYFLHLPDLDETYFNNVKNRVENLFLNLEKAEMKCEDAKIIEDELRTSMRLILHGAKLGMFKLNKAMGKEEKQRQLEELLEDIKIIIRDYKVNWLHRNKSGGLEDSICKMESLKSTYVKALSDCSVKFSK